MSSSCQHTEWILETIDHLRKRKARPDLKRICHVVKRRFGLSNDVTEAKLEGLVDREIVIKVDYKGSTSYRNASKWRKSLIGCAVQNSTTISTKIIEAILALSNVKNGSNSSYCAVQGITTEKIERWLSENFRGFSTVKSPLTIVLHREMEAGRIELLKDGGFIISRAQKEELKNDEIRLLSPNNNDHKRYSNDSTINKKHSKSPSPNKTEQKEGNKIVSCTSFDVTSGDAPSALQQPSRRGRPPKTKVKEEEEFDNNHSFDTGKISKFKNVGDEPRPKIAKTSQSPNVSIDACSVCSKEEGDLLYCTDCAMRVHPGCLKLSGFLAVRAMRGPWQCSNCKVCCICHKQENKVSILVCDGCDQAYHSSCHAPPVSNQSSGSWECYQCRLRNCKQEQNDFAASHLYLATNVKTPPTPAESPIPQNLPEAESKSKFPDASKWSVEEVAEYFTTAGFPQEANVFKEQEIDGVALLLLNRCDILKGLDFKLGPALKVNRLVQGFQTAKTEQINQVSSRNI